MKDTEKEGEEKGFNPDELFDKKKFNTVLVKGETFSGTSHAPAELIERLFDTGLQRAELEQLYNLIKKEKLGPLLLETSVKEKDPERKTRLLAACWEIDVDASSHVLPLTKLVFDADFKVALEALTVLETIEALPASWKTNEALLWAEKQTAPFPDLANPAIQHLKSIS